MDSVKIIFAEQEVYVKYEQLIKIKQTGLRLSERCYFVMFVILTSYFILSFVPIDIIWKDLGKGIPIVESLVKYILLEPYMVLLVIAVLRFACSETYHWAEIAAAVVIFLLTRYAVMQNRYTEVLIMILLMLGAKDISFKKIVKVYFLTALVIVAGVFLLSQVGIIENYVYRQNGRNIRMAFGFTYPTRFAAHLLFLFFWYWYLRGKKLRYAEAVFPAAAGAFVLAFCEARLSAASLVGLSLVMLWQVFQYHKEQIKGRAYHMNTWIAGILSLSIPIASVAITALTMLYHSDSPIFKALNSLLSSRLYLSQKAMDLYGFRIWGQWIRLAGNGEYLVSNPKYFYIDGAFLQFAVQYGIVMLLLIVGLFWYVGIRAQKEEKWILLWIMAFIALHGMFEPHTLRIGYCPLIYGVFAKMEEGETKHEES